jgi:hypothetical protein
MGAGSVRGGNVSNGKKAAPKAVLTGGGVGCSMRASRPELPCSAKSPVIKQQQVAGAETGTVVVEEGTKAEVAKTQVKTTARKTKPPQSSSVIGRRNNSFGILGLRAPKKLERTKQAEPAIPASAAAAEQVQAGVKTDVSPPAPVPVPVPATNSNSNKVRARELIPVRAPHR